MSSKIKWRRFGVVFVAGLIVLGSGAGMMAMFNAKAAVQPQARIQLPQPTQEKRTTSQSARSLIQGYGTAEALQKAHLSAEVSGRVVFARNDLREGSYIKRGQLLVRINTKLHRIEYKRLKKQVHFLTSQFQKMHQAGRLLRIHAQRSRTLLRKKVIDKKSYEQMHIRLLEHEQRKYALHAQIENIKSSMARTLYLMQKSKVRAPFSGRIVSRKVRRNSFVREGQVLVVIESMEAVEIPVSLPLSSIKRLKISDDAHNLLARRISARVSCGSGHSWLGHVVRVGSRLSLKTRTLPLWVRVNMMKKRATPQSSRVLPGAFCRVFISRSKNS